MPNILKDPLGWLGWLLSFPVAVLGGAYIMVSDWWFVRSLKRDVRRRLGLPPPPVNWRGIGKAAWLFVYAAVTLGIWVPLLWWMLGAWSLILWVVMIALAIVSAWRENTPLTHPRQSP